MDMLSHGILLTILGMGVVSFSLVGLMVLIRLLERFLGAERTDEDSGAQDAEVPREDDEIEVVLAAAAGYFLETERPGIQVPQVRRGANAVWARAARLGHINHRRG